MPCTCFDLPRTVDLGVFAPVFRQDDLRLVISERNRQAKTHFENGAETKKNGSILKLTVQLPSLTDFEYEFVGIFLRVKDIHFELICVSETCWFKASDAY